MLNILPSSPRGIAGFLPMAYELRLPVFLWGKPGVGKSEVIRDFARGAGMDLIDLRLTTLESCDLRGLPRINHRTGQVEWMRPEFLPEIDVPVVIFLDELTAAEPRLQASAYQLILDRCVGKHRLPPQAWVAGAGNAPEDGAISYGMGSALSDRFLHLNTVASLDDWIAWALTHDIAPEVITFLRVRPDMLDSCGGQEGTEQMVRPSPRSWARVSTILRFTKDLRQRTMGVNGYVGEAVAVQFFHTLEELSHLPPIDRLLSQPAKRAAGSIPATLPTLYGLTYSLVRYAERSEHFERSIALLDAVANIGDALPRREIQTLGMELLLAKAHQTGLFSAVTGSETYGRLYSSKADELVQ